LQFICLIINFRKHVKATAKQLERAILTLLEADIYLKLRISSLQQIFASGNSPSLYKNEVKMETKNVEKC